jgi:hypothetical protein
MAAGLSLRLLGNCRWPAQPARSPMKTRTATAGTALRAGLTAVGFAALTIVGAASVGACSTSPPKATLPKLSPGPTVSTSAPTTPSHSAAVKTPSPSAASGGSSSPAASASRSPRATPTASDRRSPARTHSRPFPAAAPATGGGGTAGLRDAWLLGLGGAAILAGAGCLVYRRRHAGVGAARGR